MTPEEIETFIAAFRATGLREAELERGDTRLLLRARSQAVAAPEAERVEFVARAPMFGRIMEAHPQRPLAKKTVGDSVEENEIVGYVSAGGALAAISAPGPGVITRQLAVEGELVGYNQVIFLIS